MKAFKGHREPVVHICFVFWDRILHLTETAHVEQMNNLCFWLILTFREDKNHPKQIYFQVSLIAVSYGSVKFFLFFSMFSSFLFRLEFGGGFVLVKAWLLLKMYSVRSSYVQFH